MIGDFEAGHRAARLQLVKLLLETEKQPRPLPGFSRAATAVAKFLYEGEYAIEGEADIEPVIEEASMRIFRMREERDERHGYST